MGAQPADRPERTHLAAALAYAARGWHMFPVYGVCDGHCACGDAACLNPGKHPMTQHGCLDASTDPTIIRRWAGSSATTNIGAATGAMSGYWVLDVDARHGGMDSLDDLEAAHGPLPSTPMVLTGGGGAHILFHYPTERSVRNRTGIAPGIDVRGDGGYHILPKSMHISGHTYEWEVSSHPNDVPLADAPDWLLALVYSPTNGSAEHEPLDTAAALAGAPEGQRNEVTWRLACKLRGAGVPYDMARTLVLTEAANCAPPYPERDAFGALARAYRTYEPNEHRNGRTNGTARAQEDGGESQRVPLPFPLDALPKTVRAYVEEGAAALGCPPEFVALPLLTFAGAAMGNRWRIVLKSDYRQLPALFTVVVAPPGRVKSPALDLARAPLDVLQCEARDAYKLALADYELALADWSAARKRGELAGEQPQAPVETHFYTTDATMEALAQMLEGSPGICLIRDEAVAWVASFDAYRNGRGADRQNWLSLWSGSILKVDRKGKPSIYVQHPVVGFTGGTQPDSLPALAAEAQHLDGFIERLLWAWPDSEPARWTEKSVSQPTKDSMLATFRAIVANEGEVSLSDEARTVWVKWYDDVHEQARTASGLMAGILSKLPNQIARIALILHVLADPASGAGRPVAEQTMRDALLHSDYFVSHAARVLPALTTRTGRGSLADRVLKCLEAAGVWVNNRQLYQSLGGHVSAADLAAALTELEEHDFIERRETPTTERGGRPGAEWRCTLREQTEQTNKLPP